MCAIYAINALNALNALNSCCTPATFALKPYRMMLASTRLLEQV